MGYWNEPVFGQKETKAKQTEEHFHGAHRGPVWIAGSTGQVVVNWGAEGKTKNGTHKKMQQKRIDSRSLLWDACRLPDGLRPYLSNNQNARLIPYYGRHNKKEVQFREKKQQEKRNAVDSSCSRVFFGFALILHHHRRPYIGLRDRVLLVSFKKWFVAQVARFNSSNFFYRDF